MPEVQGSSLRAGCAAPSTPSEAASRGARSLCFSGERNSRMVILLVGRTQARGAKLLVSGTAKGVGGARPGHEGKGPMAPCQGTGQRGRLSRAPQATEPPGKCSPARQGADAG